MEYVPIAIHSKYCRTNSKLSTPFYNPSLEDTSKEEVEITNPTHPLFGCKLPIISVSSPPIGESNVFVQYQGHIVLKIPISATSLGYTPFTLSAKLSLSSLKEIIKIFKETKELCHIKLSKSSKIYQNTSKKK